MVHRMGPPGQMDIRLLRRECHLSNLHTVSRNSSGDTKSDEVKGIGYKVLTISMPFTIQPLNSLMRPGIGHGLVNALLANVLQLLTKAIVNASLRPERRCRDRGREKQGGSEKEHVEHC
jgi:hypothetical protein